MNSVKHTVEF